MSDPSAFSERYARQLSLQGFGSEGQHRLRAAAVLVIGAGGLGCPVLQYLAAAGVGTIGIADFDRVSLSNLHRQPLYTMNDIGQLKAEVAAGRLSALNPDNSYRVFTEPVDNVNVLDVTVDYDLVVDGSDNFTTRYLVSDACALVRKPLVFGAVSRFQGQVAVFNVPSGQGGDAVHYRDMFPHPPAPGEVRNCADEGVLGVLPGIIGSLMAAEAIKLITGTGDPLIGKLLTYDALRQTMHTWQIAKRRDSDALLPASAEQLRQTDYRWLCEGLASGDEIDAAELPDWIYRKGAVLVDLREAHEKPHLDAIPHRRMTLAMLQDAPEWQDPRPVLFICQSGRRSLQALRWWRQRYNRHEAYSIRGGVDALMACETNKQSSYGT